jgi:uncharacterized protein (DUF58 family)
MFDRQFQQRCESLSRAAKRLWGGQLLGRRAHTHVAGGTEVTGYGDYVTGDDFRYVDWNRAARLDELVSKRFAGSQHQRVYLLLDASASMSLGRPSKFDAARQAAAAVAYVALANHDLV